jgi:hypothetical protein
MTNWKVPTVENGTTLHRWLAPSSCSHWTIRVGVVAAPSTSMTLKLWAAMIGA